MAKKAKKAKKSKKTRKVRKTRRAAPARKARVKRKAAARKKPARRAKPKTIGQRIKGAFQTAVEVVKETGELRDRLEPPGTSETQ